MLKNILISVEVIILAFFIIPVFSNIINAGNIAGIIITSSIITITLLHKKFFNTISILWQYAYGKILLIILGILIIFAVFYTFTLTGFIIAAEFNKPENPYAVIVLGCKVRKDEPSLMLKRRLDAAVKYLDENKNIICIVSGGQGSDEKISEAEGMKVYLVEKGIDSERIIKEDKSVNTYENLSNSFEIANIDSEQEIAIVTDGFHQYRAGYIAQKMGYKTTAINAVKNLRSISLDPTYYVREWMAITKEYISNA